MKIFGGSFGAFRLSDNRYNHRCMAASGLFPDELTANQHFIELAHNFYPESSGYYGHYASVAEVTHSQVQDYLRGEK